MNAHRTMGEESGVRPEWGRGVCRRPALNCYYERRRQRNDPKYYTHGSDDGVKASIFINVSL